MTRPDAPAIVKIGRSDDPQRRALDLASGHCFLVRVVAVFYNVGHRERIVHEHLQDSRVDGGTGKEWFRSSLLSVYQAIAMGTAGELVSAPLPEGPLTPAVLGEYIRLTDLGGEASTAAQIRGAIANATGMEKRQVAACLEAAGLEEVKAHYRDNGFGLTKRVYKKDRLFAALVQTLHWTADEALADEAVADEALADDEPMVQGNWRGHGTATLPPLVNDASISHAAV